MPNISNAELIELIKAGVNVKENYEKLYNQNRGFMFNVIRNRAHGVIEIDDLMQSAFLALVKAVELFDPEREQINFLEILKFSIWNELQDRDLPAHMVTKIIKYNKAKDKLYTNLNRKATDYEIALEMKIELNELDTIKAAIRLRRKVSLDKPIGEDGDTTILDIYADEQADEDTDFDSNVEKQDLRRLLKEAISRLPEVSNKVIEKRYFKKFTLEKCGQELNVSRERVRQLEFKAFRQLRKDKELERKLEGYLDLNEYKSVGSGKFNTTHISAVEWLVIEREKIGSREQEISSWLNK